MLVLLGLALLGVGGPWLFVQALTWGRVHTVDDAPARDVALVMGAGIRGSQPSSYLQGRLDIARDLYRAEKVRVIIVSGHTEANYSEPSVMLNYLVAQGVPRDAIVLDHLGDDTFSSCVRARTVFGVDRLTVVTQLYHVPRSVASCRLVGVDAIGVGDDSVARNARYWSYQAREVGGDLKLVGDWLTNRAVPTETRSDEVREALA